MKKIEKELEEKQETATLTEQRRRAAEPNADRADQRRLPCAVGADHEVERRPGREVDGVAVGLDFF